MDSTTQKAKEIFISFAGKIPEEEWEARLEAACEGDESLKHRVWALLRAHAEPKSYLDELPGIAATVVMSPILPGSEFDGTEAADHREHAG
jgi:hypothetical protein